MKKKRIRIDIDESFYNTLLGYIKSFKKAHGIDISTIEATRKIDNKIKALGGLVVE